MMQSRILAWTTPLLLVVLTAQTARAASIEVIDQGGGEFYVGLVLEPQESVLGVQLELAADGGNILAVGPAVWNVPLIDDLGSFTINPWTLTSTVVEREFIPGAVLVAHTFNRGADIGAALTSDYDAIIRGALGLFDAFRDPAFAPTSLPLAYVTVDSGTVVAAPRFRSGIYPYVGYSDAICVPGQLSACDLLIPDEDLDGDGISRFQDNCPGVSNSAQQDRDHDGIGDACNDADDRDGDEWADALDICVHEPDIGQADTDQDGLGDACNDLDDRDGDEWGDRLDNCPKAYNPDQHDDDADGRGNACDPAGVRPRPAAWVFTIIAETGDGLADVGAASLNDAGNVAFAGSLGDPGAPEGYAVFTGAGASLLTITTSPLSIRRAVQTRINADGLVALEYVPLREGLAGSLIHTGMGGDLRPRAGVAYSVRELDLGALDDAGELVLLAHTDTPGQLIRRSGTAPLIGAILYDSDAASERGAFRDLSLGDAHDNRGRVAFLATHADGRRGIFRGDGVRSSAIATDAPEDGGAARFLDFPSWELPLASGPAMNDRGTVAFVAVASCPCVAGGAERAGLFTSSIPIDSTARFKRSIIAFGEPYAAFIGGPSISDTGLVTFQALMDDGTRAIFAGGHPVADRVIQLGDALSGSIVSDLELHHQAINDSGQVAFTATLEDGRRAVYRADPLRHENDRDGDGLDLHEEKIRGTDPANPDSDGDLSLDGDDNCPSWPNPEQLDVDLNGIGNACECGDQSGDGTVDIRDAHSISSAVLGLEAAGVLCDANEDELCNVADILGVNGKLFGAHTYCSRYPSPGP